MDRLLMVKDPINFSDFLKLDLRVGKVVAAENVDGSEKLIRMKVDFGADYGIRLIFAGIAKYYTTKDLLGKKFIFLPNLAPKKMMEEESNGMVLAAESEGKCLLVPVNKKIKEGTIIR